MNKTSKNKLTYIPNAKNTCISSEEAQHVYEAIKLEKPVLPIDKAPKVHPIPEVINPYEAALSQELDVHGNVDPLGCAECNDLRLSVLSTELSYKDLRRLQLTFPVLHCLMKVWILPLHT